ncbi:MAG: hypothetical protein KIS72_12955, partial [Luteimonas sp.]|nr:hypothetical protein [Luteimonas sp.]
MTDPDQTLPETPVPGPAAAPAAASAPNPPPAAAGHRWLYAVLAVFVASLAFGTWGLWRMLADAGTDPRAQLATQQARIDDLEQRVATLTRSDQISRDANRDLQGTLAERDEEISALRADVAFYERFVGSTAQRRGLAVHELALRPQAGDAWHYTATLTQNLNRGAVSSGQLTLSIEGTQGGKLRRLGWADLRQQPGAPGVEYSFKYFQQVEGDIMLPPGFQPLR